MNTLNELQYTDAYGEGFKDFYKKWKSRKKDSSLFVQFLSRDKGLDNRQGYVSPSHSDPMGVYGYPLWYVIDHPSDIWYGQQASYLRVLQNVQPRKTLQLQYVDYSDVRNLLYKAKLSDGLISTLEKEFKGYSQYGKILFNLIQRNYTSKEDFTIRSAKEQADIIKKMGFLAIEDRASRQSQAVINEREPVQICFVSPLSFKILDAFKLKGREHIHQVHKRSSLTVDQPSEFFLRSIAQRIFKEVFNDKIDKFQKGEIYVRTSLFRDIYFSKSGRSISIEPISTMDRTGLKFGQKPYKAYKKSNRWALKIFIDSEYGQMNYVVHMEDSIALVIDDISKDIASSSKNPNWQPLSKEKFITDKENEYEIERKEAQKRGDEKLLGEFDSNYASWIELAKEVNANVPNYTHLTDEEKLRWLKCGTALGNLSNHNRYGIENSNEGQVIPLDQLLPRDSLERMVEVYNWGEFLNNFFLPILRKAQPWITRYSLPNVFAGFITRRKKEEEEEKDHSN